MTNVQSVRGRFSFGVLLSLGAIVLGVGCIAWASVSIAGQSARSIEAYRSPSSSPTTFAAEPVRAAVREAVPSLPPPAEGDIIGSLSIPVLKQEWPLVEGTGTKALKKGVGHYAQSVMPGVEDNCVLSGHRDTVFTRLGKLKIGDQMIVKTASGTFTYQVDRIRIVDKDDRTVIVPTDHAELTVSTCYPFNYVGNAPDRYILSGNLVARQ